jgi:hypothetical protein
MKRLMSLGMMVLVLAAAGNVGATVYNYGTNWDGNGLQGDGGVWYTMTTAWDKGNQPATYSNMAWNGTAGRWDDSSGYVSQYNVQSYTGNLFDIIAFQGPVNGTVDFHINAINWSAAANAQIRKSDGSLLDSRNPGNGTPFDMSVSTALTAGERIYFLYKANNGGDQSNLEMATNWQGPIIIEANFTPVPEPMTMGLLAMGGLLGLHRRK